MSAGTKGTNDAIDLIESAPRNQFVILQDERKVSDVYEIARWSTERGGWICNDGEPIQITPTHWLPIDHLGRLEQGAPRGWRRFGMYAAIFVTAGLAMMFAPSVFNSWAGLWEKESFFVVGSFQDAANSLASAIEHQQAAEQERQKLKSSPASWPRLGKMSEVDGSRYGPD